MILSGINSSLLRIAHLSFKKCYLMSGKDGRIEEIGFKTQNIINTSQLTHITSNKLEFVNGKCLLYKSKKGLLVTLKRYLGYYSSISTIGTLIYTNPFVDIFPAAIPILWVIELIIIKMMLKRYLWNQSIAHQIYLTESGSATEIHFADKLRRKLFGEHLTKTYYNSIFANPDQKEKQEIMPNSNPFPQNFNDFEKSSLGWAWCKYYSNGQNYVLIPKNYQSIKKDALVQLFKGKTIKNH